MTYERPFTVSFPLTPLDGGVLLPYECHPGNTAISLSLAAERAEDKAHAEDLAKGINRPRRTVQDDGAGVGAAPAARGRPRCRRVPPPASGIRNAEAFRVFRVLRGYFFTNLTSAPFTESAT